MSKNTIAVPVSSFYYTDTGKPLKRIIFNVIETSDSGRTKLKAQYKSASFFVTYNPLNRGELNEISVEVDRAKEDYLLDYLDALFLHDDIEKYFKQFQRDLTPEEAAEKSRKHRELIKENRLRVFGE